MKTCRKGYRLPALWLLALCLFASCGKGGGETDSDTPHTGEDLPAQRETETAPETLPAGILSKTPLETVFYTAEDARAATKIAAGEPLGMRFGAGGAFDGVSVCCPSWGNSIGNLRLSLYAWDTDYDKTVAAQPVATELYEDFDDNERLYLYFSAQQPGEYLFLLSDATETVGVWEYASTAYGGYLYTDGLERRGAFEGEIYFCQTPETPLVPCASVTDLSYFVHTPPQSEYPADSVWYTKDPMPDTWDATDALGRVLPSNAEAGDVREDRFVGMFYWDWHHEQADGAGTYDVTKILAEYPEAAGDIDHPAWGPLYASHHWDEPLFGYYDTVDEWVLRRHAEMLADAGVDVIIFDNTNGTYTWRSSYRKIFEVFAKAREDGVHTPQIAFLLPFGPGDNTNTQLERLYSDIYRPGKYQDLWFYWKGKPLMMAYTDALSKRDPLQEEILEFFTFRPGQPSYTAGQERKNQWGWLSVYPQQVYKNADGTPEQISVSVAQNHSAQKGLTAMNGEDVFGRTYTSAGYDTREDAVLWGANFAEQWEYALQVDPEFVFVTGWNEWIAGRHPEWGGVTNAFPDEYNDMYSRDIEPSAGFLQDNYYYQLVSYIRRYKGVRALPESSEKVTISVAGDISAWEKVTPVYYSYPGNTEKRDADGYPGHRYTNETGRNDIVEARVARDDTNLYFYVACDAPISPDTDPGWMRLLLDTRQDGGENWEGYEYILNREKAGVLERSRGGWSFETVGTVTYSVSGKVLTVAIPRALLGLEEDGFTLGFKWADNNLYPDEDGNVNILDFYQYGDAAPGARFRYRYEG